MVIINTRRDDINYDYFNRACVWTLMTRHIELVVRSFQILYVLKYQLITPGDTVNFTMDIYNIYIYPCMYMYVYVFRHKRLLGCWGCNSDRKMVHIRCQLVYIIPYYND